MFPLLLINIMKEGLEQSGPPIITMYLYNGKATNKFINYATTITILLH
jgi:hypothetical protein